MAWFYVLWLAGIALFISKSYFFYGLGIAALLLFATIAVSVSLKCPNCGKNIAIAQKAPQLGPDWQAALARHAEGAQVTQGAFERPWK